MLPRSELETRESCHHTAVFMASYIGVGGSPGQGSSPQEGKSSELSQPNVRTVLQVRLFEWGSWNGRPSNATQGTQGEEGGASGTGIRRAILLWSNEMQAVSLRLHHPGHCGSLPSCLLSSLPLPPSLVNGQATILYPVPSNTLRDSRGLRKKPRLQSPTLPFFPLSASSTHAASTAQDRA